MDFRPAVMELEQPAVPSPLLASSELRREPRLDALAEAAEEVDRRELLLGGVTRTLLAQMPVPVLISR